MKTKICDPAADLRRGTAVNVDCDAVWYMYAANDKKLENVKQMCIDWFDSRYKDCGVSDVMYHIDQHVPSATRESYMQFYLDAQKTGKPLDDCTARQGELMYRVYVEHDTDPYAIWFEECRKNGINPWLSFRMNDVHAPFLGYACTEFYYKAKENGWLIGLEAGGCEAYSHCLDYAVPEVRAYFLSYIDEILGRYDPYGIELDWQREIHNFKVESKDNCKYMDIFMADLNKIVEKYEKQYGHEIRIISRNARDLTGNLYFGFDIVNWAKNGWVDIIVPASHGPTDSAVPIAEWKEALDPYGVELYIGFEWVTLLGHVHTPDTLAAFSSMYLQLGVDKIYLYNLFNSSKEYYKVCSSLTEAMNHPRHSYIITKQTKMPRVPECSRYIPLPVTVTADTDMKPLVIHHGQLVSDAEAYLYIGIADKEMDACRLIVLYNGITCEYKGAAENPHVGPGNESKCVLSYLIPKDAWVNADCAEITFSSDEPITVSYAELMNG